MWVPLPNHTSFRPKFIRACFRWAGPRSMVHGGDSRGPVCVRGGTRSQSVRQTAASSPATPTTSAPGSGGLSSLPFLSIACPYRAPSHSPANHAGKFPLPPLPLGLSPFARRLVIAIYVVFGIRGGNSKMIRLCGVERFKQGVLFWGLGWFENFVWLAMSDDTR
jgi:hypothetical protein